MTDYSTIDGTALQGLINLRKTKKMTNTNPDEIIKDRAKTRGDFEIMMRMFTKQIEAKLTVCLQKDVTLPSNFGALLMVDLKNLREAFKHDPDNGVDAHNYNMIAQEIGRKDA